MDFFSPCFFLEDVPIFLSPTVIQQEGAARGLTRLPQHGRVVPQEMAYQSKGILE